MRLPRTKALERFAVWLNRKDSPPQERIVVHDVGWMGDQHMARRTGMSRSTFAQRFREKVGEAPIGQLSCGRASRAKHDAMPVEEASGNIDELASEWCRDQVFRQVMDMGIEERLRDKLEKVEALYFGASTAGEKEAAEAAMERLRVKLAETGRQDPPVEMQFSMPDPWAVRLFVALCRRYGIRPFRYPRQRRTTIMVRAPRGFFEAVILRQFSDMHTDLWAHFEETTDRLIREAVHCDTSDAETVPAQLSAR